MEDTIESLTKQYAEICTQIGDVQFKIKILSRFIDDANAKLLELDQKAAKIKAAESEAQAQSGA